MSGFRLRPKAIEDIEAIGDFIAAVDAAPADHQAQVSEVRLKITAATEPRTRARALKPRIGF